MQVTGLHLLLTYQCTLECDHCFVWGSPRQQGVMSLDVIHLILAQAREMGAVRSIYFEGGEPFLYYATLVKGVQEAAGQGYEVGIVSNAYWAISEADALKYLRPLAGLVQDLTVSSDLFHASQPLSREAHNASAAAKKLGIPTGLIQIAQPAVDARAAVGQIPEGEGKIMFRGRAAKKLSPGVSHQPWTAFDTCPYEDLVSPGRVHLDPQGNVHICQGIVIGNFFETPLEAICEQYDPMSHPIVGPLLRGGPAELVQAYGMNHAETYADACHLCYESRLLLRERFPAHLAPDGVYGIIG